LHVVVVAPWLPERPARHAGGAAVARHLEALSAVHDVTLVAPVVESQQLPAGDGIALRVVRWTPARGRAARWVSYLRWLRAGVGWSPRAEDAARAALQRDDWLRPARPVDLVEAQYLESLPIAHALAARLACPLVVWAHDLVTVELRRQLSTARGAKLRFEARARLRGAQRVEHQLLPSCRGVAVFNPVDAERLRQAGLPAQVKVVQPAIAAGDAQRHQTEPVVLLVAAFGRPVNREGLEWFLSNVWPRIRREVPEAVLRLVGSEAPQLDVPGVHTVGFVTDLGPEYRRARVAVAPVLIGAGLKFKVPQAFSWGVPVVATGVAAEGLDPPPDTGFAAVTDDDRAFSAAVVEMLADPDRASAVGAAGARWWTEASADWLDEAGVCDWYVELTASGG
jgi:glycosyltransferase involved in cell wall biosynthesis